MNICKVLNVCFFVSLLFLGGCSSNEAKWEEVEALISLDSLEDSERALKICKEIEADDPTAKRDKIGVDVWILKLEKVIRLKESNKRTQEFLDDIRSGR